MILCGDNMYVGGEGVGAGGGCPPRKDIGRQDESVGHVKNSYVTIINRS